MGLANRIKTFILAPVNRYFIYKRIVQGELGSKERFTLAGGDAKGKKLIFKAIKDIKNSEIRRADSYFSIYNTDQVNDEIYRKEQQLVRGIIDILRNELTKYPKNQEREVALDTMDLELNEYVELMNKARRNVEEDLTRREEVWDIPEEKPQQNFSIKEWERLKFLNDQYFFGDEGIKKIEGIVLWKSKKLNFNVKDTVVFVHKQLILRDVDSYDSRDDYLYCDPTDIVLNDRIEHINKYINEKINDMYQDYHLKPMPPETKEHLEKQMARVEQLKKDFKRMTKQWEELRRFSVESGASCTEEEKVCLEAIYDYLYQLEKRYEEYNNGWGLTELERVREKLELRKPEERSLPERLEEAKVARSGPKAIKNMELSKPDAGKESRVSSPERCER